MKVPIDIPSLYGGVTRQPVTQRHPHQVQEADNCLMALSRGCEKRPGTEFIKSTFHDSGKLDVSGPVGDMFYHWIDRDETHRFLVVVDENPTYDDETVRVFDLQGNRVPVTVDAGLADPIAYLQAGSSTPKNNLSALSNADYTFLANREVPVTMSGTATSYTYGLKAKVKTTKGVGQTTIDLKAERLETKVEINDTFTVAGNAQVYTVTNEVLSASNELVGITFTPALVATATAGAVVTFNAKPVRNSINNHYRANYTEFDYPPEANGEYWYASDDSVGYSAGFYVSQNYNTEGPKYAKVRTEEANYVFNSADMPVVLEYDPGSNTFTLRCLEWNARYSGDSGTNPPAPLVGKAIRDMIFHEDRLWFAAGERLVASCSGDYYNLWRDNWRVSGDSDPIDTSVAGSGVNNVSHLVDFSKALLVFTDAARQFEIRASGDRILSPATVSVLPATAYKASSICRPKRLGAEVYFPADRGAATQVYEYSYDPESVSNLAPEVTLHVDDYIEGHAQAISVSETHNLLFVSSDVPNVLYVYQPEWSDREKIQSAWMRWTFDSDSTILAHNVYGDYLYIVFKYTKDMSDGVWIERVHIAKPPVDVSADESDIPMPYAVRCDRRLYLDIGTYNSAMDRTEWTLPFEDDTIDTAVLSAAWGNKAGKIITCQNITDTGVTKLVATGRLVTGGLWVGRGYEQRVELSPQFYRDQNGKTVQGRLQLRTMTVIHRDTGYYEVQVRAPGRELNTFKFMPQRAGSFFLNQLKIEEYGEFNCKPMVSGTAQGAITLVNGTPLPSTFAEIHFTANFVPYKASASGGH